MDLYEYQARDLFEKYGVPVLAGIVADTPEDVRKAAEQLGGVVVVKAQVKTGGRGKAGGVKVAKTPDEAEEAAKAILGLDIKGHVVKRVMAKRRRAGTRRGDVVRCRAAGIVPAASLPGGESHVLAAGYTRGVPPG